MKNATIITGSKGSGKSNVAKFIANHFYATEVVWYHAMDFGDCGNIQFVFAKCTENTKLIIIEEIDTRTDFNFFMDCIDGIIVHRKLKSPFNINPKILLVCDSNLLTKFLPKDKSFKRCFDVFECITDII